MAVEPKARSIRLLIVDDEPLMVKLLAIGLQRVNPHFQIDTATDGQDALTLIDQITYDLALLDYRMPGIDGIKLAQAIRHAAPHTQLMLMTAYGEQAIAEARAQISMDGYFTKPVSMQTLREMVNNLLVASGAPAGIAV